jgi:hypothetical protein
MRLLARGTATAIATIISLGANAADLDYPPPVVGPPQYGMAPPLPPAPVPSQVVIVPGPTLAPQYPSASVPPPPPGAYPYGAPPATIPRADLAPSANCPLTWHCGAHGCGWQPSCVPPPERYSGQYDPPSPRYIRPESPGPQPGPQLGPQPGPQLGPQPGPQVYAPSNAYPSPEPYPAPYSSGAYPGPTGPYWR